MTNAIPIIQNVAEQHGFNVSAAEITLIVSAGGAAIRWIQLELRAIKAAGGLRTIWAELLGPKQTK
jgi:hypothetical protein